MRPFLVMTAAAAIGGAMHVAAQTRTTNPLANLKTVPERTNYEQTSRYTDVIAFMEAVAQAAPKLVHLTTFGYTNEGRALPLAVVGAPDATAEAVKRTGKRAVLLSGWAGIGTTNLPKEVFLLKYAPHHWLFPRMAAVVHHGGAGTTAAGLRAGLPSVIVPVMSDQPFWGQRVYALGAAPGRFPDHG